MCKSKNKHFSYLGKNIRYKKIRNGKWQATVYLGKRPTKNGTKSNVTKQICAMSEKELKRKVKGFIDQKCIS